MHDKRLTITGVIILLFLALHLLHISVNYKRMAKEEGDAYSSVVNATLGFNSIQHIKLPNTTDHEAKQYAMSLTTGLSRTQVELPFQDDNSGQQSELLTRLRPHMELWQKMVDQNIPAMLILESDAIWKANIKPVHSRVANALNSLLSTHPTEDDPYSSQSWDAISFGSCGDPGIFSDTSVIFDDPEAPPQSDYFGVPLNHQRVVYRAGYLSCTTSYAISQRGAQRMLMRSAMGLGSNLDFIMGEMSVAGKLDVYSVYPPTFTTVG